MPGTSKSRIVTEVDFDKNGRQHGFLRLFHSVHSSAYGFIPIPIVVLKNGDGPTALLISGTHGDEYEGQVALCNLVKSLDPARIQGRVIILPAANFPAVVAGRRTSPIDEGNLNRLFPGDADGTVTEQIAYHIEEELVPMADLVCDLHSGGSSLMYVPSALYGGWKRDGSSAAGVAALKAFGAPVAYVAESNQGGARTTSGAGRGAEERDRAGHRGRWLRPRHAFGAAHGGARRQQCAGAHGHPAGQHANRAGRADAVPGGRRTGLFCLYAGAGPVRAAGGAGRHGPRRPARGADPYARDPLGRTGHGAFRARWFRAVQADARPDRARGLSVPPGDGHRAVTSIHLPRLRGR